MKIGKGKQGMADFREPDDILGLKKLDNKLKSLGKNWERPDNRFSKPKPAYTREFQSKKNNDELIKIAKTGIVETKKTIRALHKLIKYRKINKLEKEALKAKTEADQLAHEIKTKTALIDSMNDVKRYQKEKERIDQELEQARKGKFENE